MRFPYLDNILASPQEPLSSVLCRIDQTARRTSGMGIVLVVDGARRLLGVATEGDVRRALIDGVGLETEVARIMEKAFVAAPVRISKNRLLQLFDCKIKHIPLLDEGGRVVDLFVYPRFQVAEENEPVSFACRAPLRISFAGGGSDFSSAFEQAAAAVVSATIRKHAHAVVETRSDQRILIENVSTGSRVEIESLHHLAYDGVLDLRKAAIRLLRPSGGFTLKTWTDVQMGSGLGTSSAQLVAIIYALGRFSGRELTRPQIADLAFQAERIELTYRWMAGPIRFELRRYQCDRIRDRWDHRDAGGFIDRSPALASS